jgi:hypothetical protein
MKKDVGDCFLCEMPSKVKPFTFYSGIMKGGTTHRMLSCTVMFSERWSDLTKHQIEVCRTCQLRVWRQKHLLPVVLFGSGAGVLALLGLLSLFLLSGITLFVVAALLGTLALALGGLFGVSLRRYLTPKPKYSEIEPLILTKAIPKLPNEKHTFMTTEQYVDRQQKGMFG